MKTVRDLKIATRLTFGFGIVLMLVIVSTIIGVERLRLIGQATQEAFEQPLIKERLITDWYRNLAGGILRTKAIARSPDAVMEQVFKADAAESTKSTEVLRKQIEALLVEGEEKQLYEKIVAQRTLYLNARDGIARLKAAGEVDEANRVFESQFVPNASAYLALVKQLVDMQRTSMDLTSKQIKNQVMHSQIIMLVFVLAAIALGTVLSWYLARSISHPVRKATDVALQVARGDLTCEISVREKDELGQLMQALKAMTDSLSSIVGQVREGTTAMTTATEEIALGTQDLSARTEAQASSLEETSASMEELASAVNQSVENAREAKALALSASAIAKQGGDVVAQVVDTMQLINSSSGKIVDIISAIDGIAFQTNILALNAAVEAARAGEQGRGFAVVAAEVRSLAQRSAGAAKEIKVLITNSVQNVTVGSNLVDQAGATMHEIVQNAERVASMVTEIAASSDEQRIGIDHVTQAITQMDQVTQKNAALVEESANAAKLMLSQATSLASSVSVFKLETGRPSTRGTNVEAILLTQG